MARTPDQMRILVTGKNGQIARALPRLNSSHGANFVAVGRPELDIVDPASVKRALHQIKPDLVVNAAAFTAVDQAESDPDEAFLINRDGAGNVANACSEAGIPIIHISTDYVFSGEKKTPYLESDKTGPVSAYGKSKLAGERAVIVATPDYLIMRTSWVFSPFGNNFVATMLRLARTRDEIFVVSDQFGNPSSALDIARAILYAAETKQSGDTTRWSGIYHVSGTGTTNWAGFARQIFALSAELGGPHAQVVDIKTADYPAKAPRPANSCLSCELFARNFSFQMPHWHHSLKTVVKEILDS